LYSYYVGILLLLSLDYGYDWLAVLLLFFVILVFILSFELATLGVVFEFLAKIYLWFGILGQGGYSIICYNLGYTAV